MPRAKKTTRRARKPNKEKTKKTEKRKEDKELNVNPRERVIDEMRSFGYDGIPFVESVETSTENRRKRGKPARMNRHYHYCSWAYALMRNKIGPPEAEYSFPASVLCYIRHLVPEDIKGEFREHAYAVSVAEFCEALELPTL